MTDRVDLILDSALGTELTREEAEVLDSLMSSQELIDGDYLIKESISDDALHVLLEASWKW